MRKRNTHRAGFALIEVLVAVAVAALIMAALMRAFAGIWGGATAVRENAEAMVVAQTVLAGVTRNAVAEGEREGGAGRYTWTMTTTRPPMAPRRAVEQAPQPSQQQQQQQQQQTQQQPQQPQIGNLYRIAVVVVAPSGRRTSLETYRIASAAR